MVRPSARPNDPLGRVLSRRKIDVCGVATGDRKKSLDFDVCSPQPNISDAQKALGQKFYVRDTSGKKGLFEFRTNPTFFRTVRMTP